MQRDGTDQLCPSHLVVEAAGSDGQILPRAYNSRPIESRLFWIEIRERGTPSPE